MGEKIELILKNNSFNEDDFKKKGGSSTIHSRVIEDIRKEWNKCKTPAIKERAFQIDFVGRSFPGHGKIELSIEVDTWHIPLSNWVKLLDINSPQKIWIYLCRERDKAETNLEQALKNFRDMAAIRDEDKSNNVVIFMKVSGKTNVIKKCYLFE